MKDWKKMTRTLIAQNPQITNEQIISWFQLHARHYAHHPTTYELNVERVEIGLDLDSRDCTEEFYELTFCCDIPRDADAMKIENMTWSFLPCHQLREMLEGHGLHADGIAVTVKTKTRKKVQTCKTPELWRNAEEQE
jgi:hypothetical protein